MAAWGVGPGQLQRMSFDQRARLAARLRHGRLGQWAQLIGRFRQMAAGQRARKTEHVPGELVGITLGDDLGRLIPSELASLGVPAMRAAFAARYAEQRLFVYETRGEQHTGPGAVVACVDCSGSMSWAAAGGISGEAWAKACALALLDQARAARRDFAGILSRLAAAEPDVSARAENDAPRGPGRTRRVCAWCRGPIPAGARQDAVAVRCAAAKPGTASPARWAAEASRLEAYLHGHVSR